jgi:lipoate-protein ligase A
MKYLPVTLPSPEENLACDEALLEAVETGSSDEVLRTWGATNFFVVVGYANRVETEVDTGFCRSHGVPVLRRCSGGGTVLQGPGCVNYSLVLRIPPSGPLTSITRTNEFIMERNRAALVPILGPELLVQGHTDLTWQGRKFSGNAQKRKLKALLFHGTFLLGLDPAMIESTLRMPSKEPAYRESRRHSDFLMNVPTTEDQILRALSRTWKAEENSVEVPTGEIARLVQQKYGRPEWNSKF